jgi:hypothetical protein
MIASRITICINDEPEIELFFLYDGKNLKFQSEEDREQPDGKYCPFSHG